MTDKSKRVAFDADHIVGKVLPLATSLNGIVEVINAELQRMPYTDHGIANVDAPITALAYQNDANQTGLYFVAGAGADSRLLPVTPELFGKFWTHACAGRSMSAGRG